MSLLEKKTSWKKSVVEKTLQLEFEDNGKGEKYEVGAILNSEVYSNESKNSQLQGLIDIIS